MFTAAVLQPNSAALLKWIMRGTLDLESEGFQLTTKAGDPLPHHMTLNMGRFDESLNPRAMLGQSVVLHVDRLVADPQLGVCAAPVNLAEWQGGEVRTVNTHPHITVCLKPGSKPMLSNEMLNRLSNVKVFPLDEVYRLEAIVEECP